MPQRVAAILALLAFVVCLVAGGIQAGNPFGTTVWRALVAMGGTFVVGWVVGWMVEKMNSEVPVAAPRNNLETKPAGHDR